MEQGLSRLTAKIAVMSNGRVHFIDSVDVVTAEAEGNYVLLRRQSGSYLVRTSISLLAETLKPCGFVRIHRSLLVNRSHVEVIKPEVTGDYLLTVSGGREYTVTRTYKKNLRDLAVSWLGTAALARD
jgi:two-component system LytT family response regulator